jgi:DNA-binding CsgD family transcriptional regulator
MKASAYPEVHLTKREKQMLELIADGFSDPGIAEKLGISKNTANTHRKKLIKKFQAKNAAQLVKKAFLFGFLHVTNNYHENKTTFLNRINNTEF